MPDKPAAEMLIDEPLVRTLLASGVVADTSHLSLRKVAEGWDCEIWRLGTELAVRLPRRAMAARLIGNEALVLPRVATTIEAIGVHVPRPVITGGPVANYPWPWSVVRWIAGVVGLEVPRSERGAWAPILAAALGALHVPADPDFPPNPGRGVPLAQRAAIVEQRFDLVRKGGSIHSALLDDAHDAWRAAIAVQPWADPPVWVHGDLHPGNLIAQRDALVGIIDFGDVTGGDPAYDLGVAWLAFDSDGREDFIAATSGRYDDATWVRARGWASAVGLLLIEQSDDNPEYKRLGLEALHEVQRG
ncbi:aminoglycoside phosphotransferase family protein [Microbacterium lacus]|uniref:aminoglycoside phosphotransferase family protein n=1 Tax=Microbacterium lacus TaxID=415217 RepID=UPI00384A7109